MTTLIDGPVLLSILMQQPIFLAMATPWSSPIAVSSEILLSAYIFASPPWLRISMDAAKHEICSCVSVICP
ncbi:hypothetical protein BF95_06365 [Sphingobium sp. Ant17]|jgi:hypothetical protein|nr:hypothetical protein BF95_06365 [Sphingobium sp. Ant17]